MHRRHAIKLVGAAAAAATTGCVGEGLLGDEGDGNQTDGGGVEHVDTDFEVVSVSSGNGEDEADAELDEEAGEIVITGTAPGNNGCYSARLEEDDYDADEDIYTARIETYEDREDDEMCTEALVDIEYRLVASFEGGLPSEAEVSHDDSTHGLSWDSDEAGAER
ncbi:MAG: hypothetical protein ACOCT0_00705 [Halobacteriota archaeon]